MRTHFVTSPLLSFVLALSAAPALAQRQEPPPPPPAEEAEEGEEDGEWTEESDAPADPPAGEGSAPAPAEPPAAAEGAGEEEVFEGEAPNRPAPKGKGVIWGRITDTKLNEPALEAQVRVEGLVQGKKVETFTDYEGYYRLELPPGTYTIRVFYELHDPLRLEGVEAVAGLVQRVDAQLVPQDGVLEETLIEAKAERASLEGQILSRQKSATVQDGVGRAEISKTTDSNAAEAAQRVVGATIVDGRFVYVRGLGERYTNSLLHGAPLPSPDPNRAAVPLDLFPALVIDSINISKTFTPDLPGDFAGGSVQIETRDIPTKPLFSVSLKGGYNDQATFRDRLDHRGGNLDWLGIDSGARAIPDSVSGFAVRRGGTRPDGSMVSSEDITRIGRDMNRYMSTIETNTMPDHGFSIVGGNGYKVGEQKIGYIASINYDRSYRRIENGIHRNFLNNRQPDGSFQTLQDFTFERGSSEVRWGLFGSGIYEPHKDHRFRLTGIYSHSADDRTTRYDGYHSGLDAELSNTRLSFVAQSMVLGQFRGEHDFKALNRATLDYNLYAANARRDEPDTRDTTYQFSPSADAYVFVDGPESGRHFWSDQTEKTYGGVLNWTQPVGQGDSKIKFGGLLSTKERDFWARRFAYRWNPATPIPTCAQGATFPANCPDGHFINDNIGSRVQGATFELQEGTRATDTYNAGLDVYAGYAMFDAEVIERVRLIAGPRVEVTHQTVTPIARFGGEPAPGSVLDDVTLLPAASLVFDATKTVKFRASVSRTLARPQVRELAPFAFNDYFGGREVQGNPNLVLTKITNADVRVEYFPTLREVMALSFFVKDFTNPIEPVVIPAGESSALALTFRNTQGARVLGAEVEARKDLGFLDETLTPFSFIANLTATHSRIEVPQTGRDFITNTSRPLVNQAPLTFNASLDYSDQGTNARVSFNVVARRLVEVGTYGLPDGYLQPRPSLDATVGQEFAKHWQVKLNAENLLNAPYVVTQGPDLEANDRNVQMKYRTGRIFSIAARYEY